MEVDSGEPFRNGPQPARGRGLLPKLCIFVVVPVIVIAAIIATVVYIPRSHSSDSGGGVTPAPEPPKPKTAYPCSELFSNCDEGDKSICFFDLDTKKGDYPDCNDKFKELVDDWTKKTTGNETDLAGINEYVVGGMTGTCLTAFRYLHTSMDQTCPMPLPPRLSTMTVPDTFSLFTIGDWGPTPNTNCGNAECQKEGEHTCRFSMFANSKRINGSCTDLFDENNNAQSNVADAMATAAEEAKPVAVLNVGDNFYYGGISTPLNMKNGVAADVNLDYAFNTTFYNTYLNNSNSKNHRLRVPWFGVLGNHDYGGAGCLSDWQVQIDYTQKDPTGSWIMPYQYYHQRMDAGGYLVDLYFNEVNYDDCCLTDEHGICNQQLCAEPFYPTGTKADSHTCMDRAKAIRDANLAWLEKQLEANKKDEPRWIIMVGHFFYGNNAGQIKKIMLKHGAQLYVCGHTHEQGYYDADHMQGIPTVLTGAGGGIEFESGGSYYGFGHIAVTKDALQIKMMDHQGNARQDVSIPHPSLAFV